MPTIPDPLDNPCNWTKTCQTHYAEPKIKDGVNGNAHDYAVEHTFDVGGIAIPILKTTRSFSATQSETLCDNIFYILNTDGSFTEVRCCE